MYYDANEKEAENVAEKTAKVCECDVAENL